jgi:excisionase family DNA binding protein|tara:strand:+ start:270 stop:491 length:222 start_codon:yes stop_codon:yes gene_type:complete
MINDIILERLDKIEEQVQGNHKEKWLNLKDVSKYTSLSVSKIRRAIKGGELKVSKNGGRLLFKTYWVDKWLLR